MQLQERTRILRADHRTLVALPQRQEGCYAGISWEIRGQQPPTG